MALHSRERARSDHNNDTRINNRRKLHIDFESAQINVVKEILLPQVAKGFQSKGFNVFIHDCRSIGGSDGFPRNQLDPLQYAEDISDIITHQHFTSGRCRTHHPLGHFFRCGGQRLRGSDGQASQVRNTYHRADHESHDHNVG